MKMVTLAFTENTYQRRDVEKMTIRVVSGKNRDAVNKAFDTCSTVANKFVNDLEKAGFSGATIDAAEIGGTYGGLKVSAMICIPRNGQDPHEFWKRLKVLIPPFETWANTAN